MYVIVTVSPAQASLSTLTAPLPAQLLSAAMTVLAVFALWRIRRGLLRMHTTVAVLLGIDVAGALAAAILMPDIHIGIALMLVINIAVGALLLPLRLSLLFAVLASLGVIGETVLALPAHDDPARGLLEPSLFGVAYIASVLLCHSLERQMRATHALAEQRGLDLANLAQVNDLIIRRMKTGVMLVDDANRVHQINESAWLLLGNPSPQQRDLGVLAPELSRRLFQWRHLGKLDETAVALADGVPEVVPRFSRLAANDDAHTLIFLDDTSLVSRRAEELTLASLGRLSASIAHEIRNPLAAIRYSAQLLAESAGLDSADQRMVQIINNHCSRLNEIIENILQLSRRERSRPDTLDLSRWAQGFVDEFKLGVDLGRDSLHAIVEPHAVEALADSQHLHQVIWNLVQNALRYGRLPGEPARVMLIARHAGDIGPPLLEVVDRGPGIPPQVAAHIFEPFYTTHEYGTGLGLYLARQMCEANQGSLEYVPVAGGGSCFRIMLTPPARTPLIQT